MAEVELTVGGRRYRLAAADADAEALRQAGAELDARAQRLQTAMGQVPEARLLLMAALTVTGELMQGRAAPAAAAAPPDAAALLAAVERLEALADMLEGDAG